MVLFNIRRWSGCTVVLFNIKVGRGTVVLFNVRRLSGGKVVLFNGALSHVCEGNWVVSWLPDETQD